MNGLAGFEEDACGNFPTRLCVGPCEEFCARFVWMKPAHLDKDGNVQNGAPE